MYDGAGGESSEGKRDGEKANGETDKSLEAAHTTKRKKRAKVLRKNLEGRARRKAEGEQDVTMMLLG